MRSNLIFRKISISVPTNVNIIDFVYAFFLFVDKEDRILAILIGNEIYAINRNNHSSNNQNYRVMVKSIFNVNIHCYGFWTYFKLKIMKAYQANLISLHLLLEKLIKSVLLILSNYYATIGETRKHPNCQRVLPCKEEKVDSFPLFSEELFFLGKRKEWLHRSTYFLMESIP